MTTMMSEFQRQYDQLLIKMRNLGDRVPMNHWQSQKVEEREGMRYSVELMHQVFRYHVPGTVEELQFQVKPNLPWAEDHFLERVSGEPLNPPPSEQWWPFAQQGNREHKEGEKFSHTYPERFWPRLAGVEDRDDSRMINEGIRYDYGDLLDVVNLLVKDPLTRQAYLPVWFPEDTGAKWGQRVPCTLGYHFIMRGGNMDIVYHIRSCDLFRHFTDDVYMACRLLQWVVGSVRDAGISCRASSLVMNIASLHIFEGDEPMLKLRTDKLIQDEEEIYGAAV